MKKITCLLLLVSVIFLSLCSCSADPSCQIFRPIDVIEEKIARSKLPDRDDGGETTLELWIGEDVTDFDWSDYEYIPTEGGNRYLGKGYKTDENQEIPVFSHYVLYDISGFPDLMSSKKAVSNILITDPQVKVYGLTVESSIDEFAELFRSLGYEIEFLNKTVVAEKDGTKFSLREESEYGPRSIQIRTEITNKKGIHY